MTRGAAAIAAAVSATLLLTSCGQDEPEPASVTTTLPATPDTNDAPRTSTTTTTAAPTSQPEAATTTSIPPQQSSRGESPADSSVPQQDTFTPSAGAYRYTAHAWSESAGPLSGDRNERHSDETDDITNDTGGTVTVLTTVDGDRRQEVTYATDARGAAVTRLTTWSDQPASSKFTVHPSPPIPVARLPYTTGEKWEFAWRDDNAGLQGVGTGQVVRNERLETVRGAVDTVVLEVHQRLHGTITAELVTTTWIERATGIQWRQVIITDSKQADGTTTHSETTRTLVAPPS